MFRSNPLTYEAALGAAQNEASILFVNKGISLGPATLREDSMDISSLQKADRDELLTLLKKGRVAGAATVTCHLCEKVGHIRPCCPLLTASLNL